MTTKLSLRRLYTIYKRTAVAQGLTTSKREIGLSHVAFYSGARGVLKVLDQIARALRDRCGAADRATFQAAFSSSFFIERRLFSESGNF